MPSGSPCTVDTGPTGMIARRFVGTTNNSSTSPCAARCGTEYTAVALPTGNSTRKERAVRERLLCKVRAPAARSPTTTREGSIPMCDSRSSRPIVKTAAITNKAIETDAMISSSFQPHRAPITQQRIASAAMARPSGDTDAHIRWTTTRARLIGSGGAVGGRQCVGQDASKEARHAAAGELSFGVQHHPM